MRQGEGVEPDTPVGTGPLGRALGGLVHLESCKGCCHWSRKLVTWEEQEARWGSGSMPSGAHKQKRAGLVLQGVSLSSGQNNSCSYIYLLKQPRSSNWRHQTPSLRLLLTSLQHKIPSLVTLNFTKLQDLGPCSRDV